MEELQAVLLEPSAEDATVIYPANSTSGRAGGVRRERRRRGPATPQPAQTSRTTTTQSGRRRRFGDGEEGRNAVYSDRGILQRHAQRIRVHSLVVFDVEG